MTRFVTLQSIRFIKFIFVQRTFSYGITPRKRLLKPLVSSHISGNYFSNVNFSCWNCKTKYQSFKYFCPECSKLQKPSESMTYFELFDITNSFEVNLENLTNRFRSIQSQLHPDKFAQKGGEEQDLSLQYSSLVNKAYSSLMNPLNRALYMLSLKDIAIEESNSEMDKMFLMEIMEYNEEIDAADSNNLAILDEQNKARLTKLFLEFSSAYNRDDMVKAKALVIKIKYFVSMENRIKDIKMKSLDS